MTVFLGTRQNYQVGRYRAHSIMAIITGLSMAAVLGMITLACVETSKYVRETVEPERLEVVDEFTGTVEVREKTKPLSPYRSGMLALTAAPFGLAMFSKRGRKQMKRLHKEVFYGMLFSVTGVYYTEKEAFRNQ